MSSNGSNLAVVAISRCFVNICSDDLAVTRDFYVNLLGFKTSFDSDWFVLLTAGDSHTSIGIMQRDHEVVPKLARGNATGMYVTVVVDDLEKVFAQARELNVPIAEEPTDLFYGQRRMLVIDPNGVLVDVSSPIEPSPDLRS